MGFEEWARGQGLAVVEDYLTGRMAVVGFRDRGTARALQKRARRNGYEVSVALRGDDLAVVEKEPPQPEPALNFGGALSKGRRRMQIYREGSFVAPLLPVDGRCGPVTNNTFRFWCWIECDGVELVPPHNFIIDTNELEAYWKMTYEQLEGGRLPALSCEDMAQAGLDYFVEKVDPRVGLKKITIRVSPFSDRWVEAVWEREEVKSEQA